MERSVGLWRAGVFPMRRCKATKTEPFFPCIQLKPFKLLQLALEKRKAYANMITVAVKYDSYILERSTRNWSKNTFLAWGNCWPVFMSVKAYYWLSLVFSEVCNVARTIQSLFTDHLMHTAHKNSKIWLQLYVAYISASFIHYFIHSLQATHFINHFRLTKTVELYVIY